jgi:perosamine synthetase
MTQEGTLSSPSLLKAPLGLPIPGFIGTFMGRDALGALPSLINVQVGDPVLLPAYLCGEVVKPFLGRCPVEFYDIGEDLTVDPLEFEQRLKATKAKLVLIINYFGFLQPYRLELKEICHKYGALLIEDCAHSLLTKESGKTGDISIYSLRKHLPLPDGGGLTMAADRQVARIKFHSRIRSNTLSLLSSLKSLLRLNSTRLSRAGLSTPLQTTSCADVQPLNNSPRRVLPLSTFAYNGFGNADLGAIYSRCRADYEFWQKTVSAGKVLRPLFRELPVGVCPLGFPIVTEERTSIKEHFAANGIQLKVYWKLPQVVPFSFKTSHALARQVFTLPTYPDLRPGQREKIVTLLTSIPRSAGVSTPARHRVATNVVNA